MSRDMVYDANTDKESSVVHGIVLFKNTSDFHEKGTAGKKRVCRWLMKKRILKTEPRRNL